MKTEIILSLRGRQHYQGQDPEVIDLISEGTMEFRDGGWDISYEESELTGLEGVTTTFRVEPGKVVLTRSGALDSVMIFQRGFVHDSLYALPFGALMITVEGTHIFYDITPEGGSLDLTYKINIENTSAGTVDYHMDIRAR